MGADDYKWFASGFEWLGDYASGWQYGEQGMITELFSRLVVGMVGSVVVEIGAGNGKDLPLTLEPFAAAGYHLDAYEADPQSRSSLADVLMRYKSFSIHGAYDETAVLSDKTAVVVIDVDSIDEYIMRDCLSKCSPEIVMVEHYDIAGPHVTGASDFDASVPRWLCGMPTFKDFRIQARYERLDVIGSINGYKPVARTRVNTIYLKEKANVRL